MAAIVLAIKEAIENAVKMFQEWIKAIRGIGDEKKSYDEVTE